MTKKKKVVGNSITTLTCSTDLVSVGAGTAYKVNVHTDFIITVLQ